MYYEDEGLRLNALFKYLDYIIEFKKEGIMPNVFANPEISKVIAAIQYELGLKDK